MIRDWKTGELVEEAFYCWEDLILEDEFGITHEDWDTVVAQAAEHIRSSGEQGISERTSCLIDLLIPPLQTLWQGKNSELPFRWLPCRSLLRATVADCSLTASAIAYCLGYDRGFRADSEVLDHLRLSALTGTWKDDGLDAVYDVLWDGHSPIEPKPDGDALERIVYLAKMVASERVPIDSVDQFSTHPLKQDDQGQKQQVGLVLGGATKIKGYFLESARLPEIRGASALLDRINLEDIPALFGREIPDDRDRFERIRDNFWERTGHFLSAPECIIYAAGGNTLAFAPASMVHEIADEIERIYTEETLVANSVAVGDTFDLLELQYGLNPTQFWIEGFREACGNAETLQVMVNHYGEAKDEKFLEKKCFGELTTKLAQAQFYRREGNPTPDRTTRRDLPANVEIGPYQQRCTSCERRPAVLKEPRTLCEACTRKYVTGRVSKKNIDSSDLDHYLGMLGQWRPSSRDFHQQRWGLVNWSSLFENYLEATGKVSRYADSIEHLEKVDGPQDLKSIAEASHPSGFITFIYADGNNMGGYLENVKTPAQYRQFSERAFVTTQKAAFEALAEHLSPTKGNLHPFEIVSIGGDDLLLIVPGSKAFEVVHAIGQNFDREFNSHSKFREGAENKLLKSQRYMPGEWIDAAEMQPAISLSLGFVVANEHTPIGFLEHLADSLLKSAKSRAKTLKKPEVGYLGGTVDFLVLKSLSMITSELGDFRKSFYKSGQDNVLTMRPFTLHELHGFIQTVRSFKESDFPRSQLYQLRQSLGLGRHTSTLDYLYFRSRLQDGKGKILQQAFENNWQGVSETMDGPGPWYAMLQTNEKDRERYETLLLDLIESYDFIAEGSNRIKGDSSD